MRLAANEYGNWFTDPELDRLRCEWIAAYRVWIQLDMSPSADAVLTDEQRMTLRRYHDAEAAYFAHSRALASGMPAAHPPTAPAHGAVPADTEPTG